MKPSIWVPALVAVALYVPTVRYAFVQDDRAIILSNPAAHNVGAAVRAFDDPYWPAASGGGLYRPLTILSYAVDWTVSAGRPAWFHVMNAVWHGLATLLVALLLARWLPPRGHPAVAATAGCPRGWRAVRSSSGARRKRRQSGFS